VARKLAKEADVDLPLIVHAIALEALRQEPGAREDSGPKSGKSAGLRDTATSFGCRGARRRADDRRACRQRR